MLTNYLLKFLIIFNNNLYEIAPLVYISDCQQFYLPTTFCQQLRLFTFPITNRAIAYK